MNGGKPAIDAKFFTVGFSFEDTAVNITLLKRFQMFD
jgi:hypothetical protein